MDKIVSPVIPQPGAWKRLPRTISTSAPRTTRNRTRSTSLLDDSGNGGGNMSTTSSTIDQDDKNMDDAVFSHDENAEVMDDGKTVEKDVVMKGKESDIGKVETVEVKTEKLPKFKNQDAKFQYGNYDRYNNYRNLNEFMDVRLKVFQRNTHLFQNKDILDIGCNAGHITIAVARTLQPKTITGIDIDAKLIGKARKNLSLNVKIPDVEKTGEKESSATPLSGGCSTREKETQTTLSGTPSGTPGRQNGRLNIPDRFLPLNTGDSDYFPISFPINYGPIPLDDDKTMKNTFPRNVFFKTNNYVLKDESLLATDVQQKYDLILCLSVTKWIHLNYGDNGVKLVFKRIFNQLRPGGKLILEAQNWPSYKKKKNLTPTIFNNYKNIEFYPNKFHEYLLSTEVGFSHSYPLGIPRHLSKGFRRPIQVIFF